MDRQIDLVRADAFEYFVYEKRLCKSNSMEKEWKWRIHINSIHFDVAAMAAFDLHRDMMSWRLNAKCVKTVTWISLAYDSEKEVEEWECIN